MAARAWVWARRQVIDELSRSLEVNARRSFEDREEIGGRVGVRIFRLTLWTKEADIQVALARQLIPEGLKINEASVWGPQKNEAWSSGHAAPTGDAEFDDDFMVLSTESDTTTRLLDNARSISPALRSALIEERRRGGFRDAEIRPGEVALSVRASGTPRRAPGPQRRLAWTLGAVFLGFNQMPSAQDLRDCIARASRVAEVLEAASPA